MATQKPSETRAGSSAVLRRQLLLVLVVVLVTIIASTEIGFGFMTAEALLAGLAILGGLGYFFAMLTIRLLQKQWTAARGHAMCFVALIVAGRISDRVQDYHARASKETARPILLALDQYRDDTGRFPASLTDLTPRYLETIAVAPVAFVRERPYLYRLREDGTYNLSFPATGGYRHSYVSHEGTWRMHD